MLRRNVRSRPGMRWRVMDMTSMQITRDLPQVKYFGFFIYSYLKVNIGVHMPDAASAEADMARSEDVRNLELWIRTEHYEKEQKKHNWLHYVPHASEEEKSLVMFKDNVIQEAFLSYVYLYQGAAASLDGYIFGFGYDPIRGELGSSEIYRLNTRDLNNQWVKFGVDLLEEVKYPVVVVLDGKLYVFEDSPVMSELVFQVIDPCLPAVSALAPGTKPEMETEHDYDDLFFLELDRESKRIIFSSIKTRSLVFFHPETNKWDTQTVPRSSLVQLERMTPHSHLTRRERFYWVDGTCCLLSYSCMDDKFAYTDLNVLPSFKAAADCLEGIDDMYINIW